MENRENMVFIGRLSLYTGDLSMQMFFFVLVTFTADCSVKSIPLFQVAWVQAVSTSVPSTIPVWTEDSVYRACLPSTVTSVTVPKVLQASTARARWHSSVRPLGGAVRYVGRATVLYIVALTRNVTRARGSVAVGWVLVVVKNKELKKKINKNTRKICQWLQ